MEPMFLHLNFTGTEISDSPGIAILAPGLHSATVTDFRYFEESGRLYTYLLTDGEMHRESFSISAGIAFLGRFLVSAGVAADKLNNKDLTRFPMHKLIGKSVYFSYTPPTLDHNGERVDGTYAKYRFYTQDRWEKLVAATQSSVEDVEIETEAIPSNGGDTHAAAAAKAAPKKTRKKAAPKKAAAAPVEDDDDDFGFLIDNDDDE